MCINFNHIVEKVEINPVHAASCAVKKHAFESERFTPLHNAFLTQAFATGEVSETDLKHTAPFFHVSASGAEVKLGLHQKINVWGAFAFTFFALLAATLFMVKGLVHFSNITHLYIWLLMSLSIVLFAALALPSLTQYLTLLKVVRRLAPHSLLTNQNHNWQGSLRCFATLEKLTNK